MVDQGVAVATRDYRVRQLVDVRARDDPATRARAYGRLVLGEHQLDRRHAVFAPTLADHDRGSVDGTVERVPLGQLGDALVDLAVKPAAQQFAL